MKRYSVLVAVPEMILGMSHFRVEVEAEDEQRACEEAIKAAQSGEAEFVGFSSNDGRADWSEAMVEELLPWNFQPGQKVLLQSKNNSDFPALEVEVIQLRDHFGDCCPQCYLGRELSPHYPGAEKRYLVRYHTGITAPVRESLLHAKD